MNKKITKVLTLASAVAMPIVSAAPVFAQGAETKTEKTGPVEITGFEKEASVKPTVTAYRVVEPTYRGESITGFKAVGELKFADLNSGKKDMKVSNAEIEAAAKAVLANKKGFTASTLNLKDEKATGNLAPGMYIVLIEGSGATVYNPVLVSVNVKDANVGSASETATALNLGETKAFVKKSTPKVDKKIVGHEKDGAVMKHDDKIKFQIDTTLPSYKIGDGKTVFKNPAFNIIDTMSNGFEEVNLKGVTVTAGGKALVSGTDYNITQNGKGFKIEFTQAGLLAHSGQAVVVNYTAKLAKDAQKGIKANTNTASVEYTTSPGDVTPKKPGDGGEDKTYNYTFDLKGAFKKVDDNDKALEGAEFTVYSDKDCKNAIGKAVSDKQGMIAFEGLSVGTVYIRETKAPAGYSINDTTYQVEVSATFQETGALASYDIKVGKVGDKELKTVVTEQPQISADGAVTKDAVTKAVEIKNTTMGKMPSTGGVGTLMFTGAGVSLFLGSAAAYAKAKKANKKED